MIEDRIKGEILCDREGVPLLIQRLEYIYSHMLFEVFFFNNKKKRLPAEYICPSIDLMQHMPSRMPWLEAENRINKLAILHWREWFPSAHKEKEI